MLEVEKKVHIVRVFLLQALWYNFCAEFEIIFRGRYEKNARKAATTDHFFKGVVVDCDWEILSHLIQLSERRSIVIYLHIFFLKRERLKCIETI